MARKLHFNMGNIESSYQRNKDIPNLSQRIEKHVSYSCFYWASHLEKLEYEEMTHKAVSSFLESNLPSWLEVLSIHDVWERASLSLVSLATWASVRSSVENCLSFIRAFGVPMSQAAPHIYLSGLAFSPRESWICKQYFNWLPRLLKLKNTLEVNWHYLQGVIHGHESGMNSNLVNSVGFSADGRRIVSGSLDQTICLWDAETQQPIGEPLHGHEGGMNSVGFSDDGQCIISGSSDQTIHLLDPGTQQSNGSKTILIILSFILTTSFSS
ncbi:WD40-repeat-containing domain protein [Crucibulum laeve]|uniref:WD40-repeat-containing domain protein n=1 Tax=Crucibulum laeve TaxID=68775 RepID=A0A5C3M3F8_9AGAR|nr:WD40-repeat-containing domain protein [Crucibulum laeve]